MKHVCQRVLACGALLLALCGAAQAEANQVRFARQLGLGYLQRGVTKGYFVTATLSGGKAFDALRSNPAFQALLIEAEAGRQQALAAFREADGERLLGR